MNSKQEQNRLCVLDLHMELHYHPEVIKLHKKEEGVDKNRVLWAFRQKIVYRCDTRMQAVLTRMHQIHFHIHTSGQDKAAF